MTNSPKLSKVLEYLIKNDEEKARELLHQVFIEKARAIHEDMMSHDDDMEEEIGGSGDMGKDFRNEINARGHHDAHADAVDAEIQAMENEIDFEETMNEGDDEEELDMEVSDDDDGDEMDMDMDMDMDDDGEHSDEFEVIDDKMQDLETALAELRAEFDKLEAAERGEDEDEDEDSDKDEEEESWEMDEDFDDIAESLDLEVVTKDMEKSVPAKDVGAEQSGMSDGNKARSPVPPSQTSRFGAKPVDIGAGPDHKGYDLQAAPKSNMDAMKIADPDMKADNRRKTASSGSSRLNQEGNKPAAQLNTTAKQFGADTVGKMSPLSKGGQNLK